MGTLDRFGLSRQARQVETVQKNGGNAGSLQARQAHQGFFENHSHAHDTHAHVSVNPVSHMDDDFTLECLECLSISAGFSTPSKDSLPGVSGVSIHQDIPADWTDGVAKLAGMTAPRTFPADRWAVAVVDARRFLETWAATAHRLGWQGWELFGCCRQAPWHRIQGLGLVPLLKGDTITAMTSAEATIRTKTGAIQTFRRKPADPLHPAERCLIWSL